MRTRLTTITAALLLAAHAYAAEPPPSYRIIPSQSIAQFTVTKLGFEDVVGRFHEMDGQIRWDPAAPEASFVRWRVSVASVRTDAANRDRSLQSADYFDASRYPYLTFESTHVRAIDARTLEVRGTLTMRGVARQQTVLVRHSGSAAAPVFETDFNVDRYDFGIAGGSVMGRLIGRTARIHLRAVAQEDTL
jgi:polyisoprenoid-binding protein YceI